jgi:hypoxanthine phosphoribosyltransferase
MKKIILALTFIVSLYAQTPSQNSALNSISPSSTEKKSNGAVQKSLDSWFKKDWEPTQKKIEVKEKENNDSSFKLQTYVNKWEKYNKERASQPKKASHVEMLHTLPVIGK